jgi:hypothetical protein
MKKLGIILMAIGLIVLLSVWFLSECHFKTGYTQTVKHEKVILGGEKSLFVTIGLLDKGETIFISCKYAFLVGVLIFILGIYAYSFHHDPTMKL